MLHLKQLKEKRGSLLREADTIIRNAITEKRDLRPDESEKIGGAKSEIFRIDQQIASEESFISRSLGTPNHGGSEFRVDTGSYSITRAIAMAGAGRLDGYEAECSQEIAHRSGKAPDGFWVPHSALMETRSGMTVTADAGVHGGKTVATAIGGFINALRPMLVTARAGATLMSGLSSNLGLPRHAAASTATWKSEVAALDEATPEIEQLLLAPKRIGAWTKYSKQLVAQSSPDVEAFVRNDLMQAIAVGFDYAAINGTGADNQPRGVLATVGIGNVIGGTHGLAPNWGHLVKLVAAVANENAMAGRPGFVFSTKIEAKLRSTLKVSGGEIHILEEDQDTLVGNPWYASNNAPDNLTKGDSVAVASAILFGNWQDLILASFGDGVDMVVDPYTLATTGQTRVVVNSYADVGVRRAESFAAMKDALSAIA